MNKSRVCLTSLVVLGIFLLNISLIYAITGSMGNARMIISSSAYPELENLNGKDYVTIEKYILVKNVNDVPLNISLVADEDGQKFLEVIDSDFILEPGSDGSPTEKRAIFNIRIKDEGDYAGKINVVFSPLDRTQPGVVLTSTIIVNAGTGNDDVNVDEENGSNNVSPISGNVIGSNLPKGALFLFSSTLVLIIVLVILIYFYKKKKKKNEEKIEVKDEKTITKKGKTK